MRNRLAVLALLTAGALGAVLVGNQEHPSVRISPPAGVPGRNVPGPTAMEEAGLPPVILPSVQPPDVSRGRPVDTHDRSDITSPSRDVRKGRPGSSRIPPALRPIERTPPAPAGGKAEKPSRVPNVRAARDPGLDGRPPGGDLNGLVAPDPGQDGAEAAERTPVSDPQPPEGQGGRQGAESQTGGAPGVPGQRPAPLLIPPVLLTAPEASSAQPVQVILDRAMLAPQLRTTALEGRVVLAILVRTDGSVGQVKIEASSGIDLLDAAAVRAAESWRFRPATRDGVATESWAIIPVRFVLP